MGPESAEIIIAGYDCWVMVVVKQVWSVSLCAVQQLIVVVFCLVQSSTVTCAMRSEL